VPRPASNGIAWLGRGGIVALGAVLLAGVTLIDYSMGADFLFVLFYFVPVALFAWFLDRRAAGVMAVACGIGWWSADRLAGHVYPRELYRVWNALTCVASFALLAWGVSEIRGRLEGEHRLAVALAEALEAREKATEQIRKLQSQIQVVCAWTKRVRVMDEWMSFEDFLQSQLGITVTHGISQEAAQELRRQLGTVPSPDRKSDPEPSR